MPLLLLIVGGALLVSALRNSQGDLYNLLVTDLPGFAKWAAAIVAIGMIGYIPGAQKISWLLLAIVIFVVIASNQGVFANLANTLSNLPQASSTQAIIPQPLGSLPVQLNVTAGSSTAGSAAGTLSSAASLATTIAPIA